MDETVEEDVVEEVFELNELSDLVEEEVLEELEILSKSEDTSALKAKAPVVYPTIIKILKTFLTLK